MTYMLYYNTARFTTTFDTKPLHRSPFPPSCFAFPSPPPPPTRFLSHPGADIWDLAAGGYDLPSTLTLGSQVHHWSSGTPARAEGMWFPQPRHVFLALRQKRVRMLVVSLKQLQGIGDITYVSYGGIRETYSKLGRWRRNTWLLSLYK